MTQSIAESRVSPHGRMGVFLFAALLQLSFGPTMTLNSSRDGSAPFLPLVTTRGGTGAGNVMIFEAAEQHTGREPEVGAAPFTDTSTERHCADPELENC